MIVFIAQPAINRPKLLDLSETYLALVELGRQTKDSYGKSVFNTVELSYPVPHQERRASPPVPSVVWRLNAARLTGLGLEDSCPTCPNDMTNKDILI